MPPELSDMLRDAKSDAPTPRYSVEDFVSAGRKRQRRVRTVWAGAGSAAAVLAIAAAAVVPQVISGGESPAPVQVAAPSQSAAAAPTVPFAYPKQEFTGTIASYEAAGYTVSETALVTPGYQASWITDPEETTTFTGLDGRTHDLPVNDGELVVYRPGVYDATPERGDSKARVGTGTGWYRKGEPLVDGTREVAPGKKLRDSQLSWEYADGAWAVISMSGDVAETKLTEIAEGLTGKAPEPVEVGFKLGYLPDGFEVSSAGGIGDELGAPLPGESYMRLVQDGFPWRRLKEPVRASVLVGEKQLPQLQLRVYPSWWVTKYPAKDAEPYCAGGGQSLCYRTTADGKYLLELSGFTFVRDTELLKVLESLTFADPGDKSTWFAARESVG